MERRGHEARFEKIRIPEARPRQIGETELGPVGLDPEEIDPGQPSLTKIRLPGVCADQVGARQIAAVERGAEQIALDEGGLAQPCPRQVRFDKMRTGERCLKAAPERFARRNRAESTSASRSDAPCRSATLRLTSLRTMPESSALRRSTRASGTRRRKLLHAVGSRRSRATNAFSAMMSRTGLWGGQPPGYRGSGHSVRQRWRSVRPTSRGIPHDAFQTP